MLKPTFDKSPTHYFIKSSLFETPVITETFLKEFFPNFNYVFMTRYVRNCVIRNLALDSSYRTVF